MYNLPPVIIEAIKKSTKALRTQGLITKEQWEKALKENPDYIKSSFNATATNEIEECFMYADILEGFIKRIKENEGQ
jgi:hypothetical protein